jgi:hypothetical protein
MTHECLTHGVCYHADCASCSAVQVQPLQRQCFCMARSQAQARSENSALAVGKFPTEQGTDRAVTGNSLLHVLLQWLKSCCNTQPAELKGSE